MKSLLIIPLVLMSLVSSPSWALSIEDLFIVDGLYYRPFTTTPFTGVVDESLERGFIKNGKKEGSWASFGILGNLRSQGEYTNGLKEGYWLAYTSDGIIRKKYTGTYKNDVKVSD